MIKVINDDIKDEIIFLYEKKHYTLSRVANKFNIHKNTIRAFLVENGIKIRELPPIFRLAVVHHLWKTDKCKEKGYDLINIFEYEFVINKEVVKYRLKRILGINDGLIVPSEISVRETTV